ncbi:arylsulfatase [Reichenbachiella sp. MALMAid0571]|uniref:sulfatase family protein n=1 Tax=Reichenbachiella sp. MALMAid0571 TaxID=3143939 RepID=UPI0032DF595B
MKECLISISCYFIFSLSYAQEPIKGDYPNIVYILADDMGYGDLSSLNKNSGIKTPNMDKIVDQGVYFTDAHSNSSVCTPTRYGILTGRYAWRTRLKEGVLWGYDAPLIENKQVTVASFLKQNGYHTACIGKWHLGIGWNPIDSDKPIENYHWHNLYDSELGSNVDFAKDVSGPNEVGFDYSYVIPASLDMTPYLYLENGKALGLPMTYTPGKNQAKDGRGVIWRAGEVASNFVFEEVLENITDKAVRYIKERRNSENPFFLYFPLTAPHTPWLPGDKAKGSSQAGRYGDFVTMVDDTVGEVIEALEQAGKINNTLIIVTSDNGAHWTPEDKEEYEHRSNYAFRGQKADIYEGGHHVPYIAYWPGKIKPGTSSNQVICTTDLLATIAAIIDKPLPENAGEDSYNMLPAYLNPHLDESIRDYTIHHSLSGYFSIRKGKWKLTPHLGSGGFSEPKDFDKKEEGKEGTLYDLVNDPEETINLYNEKPKIVNELLTLLNESKQ